jgi:hypothetical protein
MRNPDETKHFENTQPAELGQLPGEDPRVIHKFYEAGLTAGSSVFFQVKLTGQYVNIDSSGWARIDTSAITKYICVPYYDYFYVVVASGDWKGYYLSFNRNSYVGAYSSWNNARYWSVEPLNCSPYPGMYPYTRSVGYTYLCCNGVADAIDKLIDIYSA